jgi:hypothetical protein
MSDVWAASGYWACKIKTLTDMCTACRKSCVADFKNCEFEMKRPNCNDCEYREVKIINDVRLIFCNGLLKGKSLASGIVNPKGECVQFSRLVA